MSARFLHLLLGTYLAVAGVFFAGFDSAARLNDTVVGLASALLAAVATHIRGVRRVHSVLGAWLVLAPFVLGYDSGLARLSDVLAGIVMFVLSLIPTVGRHVPAGPGPFARARR